MVAQWQAEIGAAWGIEGLTYNFWFAFLFSVLGALAVLVLQPYTRDIQFGDGHFIDWIEDWVV